MAKVIFFISTCFFLSACNLGGAQKDATSTHNAAIDYGPGPYEVDVVVFDDFTIHNGVPAGTQGDQMTRVAQGTVNQELEVPSSATFHQRTQYQTTFNRAANDTPKAIAIYNRGSSSTHLRSHALQHIHDIADLALQPLVVTFGGHNQKSCSGEAAEVGRNTGLSSDELEIDTPYAHANASALLNACNMYAVGAIDNASADNWIVVGGTNDYTNRPGTTLMHHWITMTSLYYDPNITFQNAYLIGNTFSAAYVSAIAAEIIAQVPGITASEVAHIIFSTATDKGDPGVDAVWGHGELNLEAIRRHLATLSSH